MENAISLIADSGIQFHTFKLVVQPNDRVINSMGFWEHWDDATSQVILEYAKYLVDHEVWVSTRQLKMEGFIREDGGLHEEINLKALKQLDEENECFAINNIVTPLETYEDKWLPLPFFEGVGGENMTFGPVNWARLRLIPQSITSRTREYKAVLAFDTKVTEAPANNDSPLLSEHKDRAVFNLCTDPELLMNFCSAEYGCGWVDEYIAQISLGGKENIPNEFPSLKYIANYLYFLKYLGALEQGLPTISLYPVNAEQTIDVDLVLDIGNSRTCGILFESAPDSNSFEFTDVKKLQIRDFNQPDKVYSDPFSMRLAFHMADFGNIGYDSETFVWPSFVRVGKEASRLIYQAKSSPATESSDQVTHHSSPKRYLWDDKPRRVEWELIRLDDEYYTKGIHLDGISTQFEPNGSLTTGDGFGIFNNFSRRALMTFVFLEVLAQAKAQINSFGFRSKHSNTTHARRLRRIVLTCPTAMVRQEQIILRKCADEAAIALNRFSQGTYNDPYDPKTDKSRVEVVPSVKDLRKDLSLLEQRKDWIYDEATCAQLVFLYAEVSMRYLNNCKKFFNLYGKVRKDLYDYPDKSITIGSIDIGGGTTDLMISAYQYSDGGTAVLTPVPLYWESFNYAGDDLLKQVIQQVILEGDVEDESERGCKGVIANAVRDRGVTDVERMLNDFFGKDTARMDFRARQMRKRFNVQISIPIAELYLEHARKQEKDKVITFSDIFRENQPSADLLDYFEKSFGFRFEEIKWKLSTARVEQIVQMVFEPLIRQLSALLFAKGCDFVLLAGRPTSLQVVSDMFLKYYPVSPDRIIALTDYRVGRWYPFQDGDGYFDPNSQDNKSIVAVGAFIALMGGKLDRLPSFRLNMEVVKKTLISTAEYMGIYDRNTDKIKEVFFSPDINRATLAVPGLPITIGFKRLPAETYPGRNIYVLDFNDERILEKRRNQYPDYTEEQLRQDVEEYKTNLKNRMPYSIQVERDYRQDREKVVLESIMDKNGEQIAKSTFEFRLQTLEEEKGYWLDTGEFTLKIKAH